MSHPFYNSDPFISPILNSNTKTLIIISSSHHTGNHISIAHHLQHHHTGELNHRTSDEKSTTTLALFPASTTTAHHIHVPILHAILSINFTLKDQPHMKSMSWDTIWKPHKKKPKESVDAFPGLFSKQWLLKNAYLFLDYLAKQTNPSYVVQRYGQEYLLRKDRHHTKLRATTIDDFKQIHQLIIQVKSSSMNISWINMPT